MATKRDATADRVPRVLGDEPSVELRRAAKIAGLKDFETPSLEQVERRRFELLGLTCGFLVALAVGIAILPSVIDFSALLGWAGGSAITIRVLLIGLAIAFGFYVFEKERYLGKLSNSLVNERVLSAALSNRLKEISSLTEAGRAVLSVLDLTDVLHVILEAAFDLLEADEGSVLLVEADDMVVAAAVGSAEPYVGERHAISDGLAGYVARSRESILLEGAPDLEGYDESIGPLDRDIASSMSVPLEAKNELLGVLNLNVTSSERRYNEYDLRALRLFGEHAAMAIRHARVLRKEQDLRAQLVELDRIRTELLGSMTHDLKTPLTSIFGSAKILKDRFEAINEDTRHDLLDSISRQSSRLLDLIKRLLDAARSQSGYPLKPGRIDVCAQIESLSRSLASASDRQIEVTTPGTRVEAFADPDAVEQVVANLIENALKYTPDQTPISVSISRMGPSAVIRVADEGPGIPQAEQAHIFEPFHRAEDAPQRIGHGLGLFIVSNLVRAMHGTVSLDSSDEGTTFTITLPTEPPTEEEESPQIEVAQSDDVSEDRSARAGGAA